MQCCAENYSCFCLLRQKVVLSGDNTWSSALADFIRNNDRPVIEACDKVLNTYQEEMLPCESFSEFCDVVGKLFCLYTDWPFIQKYMMQVVKKIKFNIWLTNFLYILFQVFLKKYLTQIPTWIICLLLYHNFVHTVIRLSLLSCAFAVIFHL